MKIAEFVDAYKAKKFMTITKNGADEKSEWLRSELEIKNYIPFRIKREIAETVVTQNIEVIDGIKKYDSINGYIGLIIASITAHTNLTWSADPVADYDLLAESGLLPQIIAEFQESHEEIDLLLHMVLEMELEDNEVNVIIGRVLNKIAGVFKDKLEGFNLNDIFGADIKPEDLAKLTGLLDKIK